MPQQRSDRGLAAAPIGRWIADTPSVGAKEVKDVAEAARALARPIEQTRKRIRRARASLTRAWIPSPRFLNCKEREGGGDGAKEYVDTREERRREAVTRPLLLPCPPLPMPRRKRLHYTMYFNSRNRIAGAGAARAAENALALKEEKTNEARAVGGRAGEVATRQRVFKCDTDNACPSRVGPSCTTVATRN